MRKNNESMQIIDYGPRALVVDIDAATKQNQNFRNTLWTGTYMQCTLMSIEDEIGLEMHPDVDQFLKIEEGHGVVLMGNAENNLYFQAGVEDGYAVFVPAGTWHNLINKGNTPIKLYSIYAPVQHPHGTVHRTREEAERAEY